MTERRQETDRGSAGASAQREYERRRAVRDARVRRRFGSLGVAAAHLLGDADSTRAWSKGADGERRAAIQLAHHLHGRHVVLLHDRRIAGRGRANIDHLTIGAGGVTVIDTKSTRGRVQVTKVGGLFSPRRELLLINGRDRTSLLDGIERQIEAVRTALIGLGLSDVDVRGALCYPNIDRIARLSQLRARDQLITIDGPRGIAKLSRRRGQLDNTLVRQLAEELAKRLPPA